MTRADREWLTDALGHIAVLNEHMARHDLADATIADAVSMRLAAAIEAVAHVDTDVRDAALGEEWAVAWATRNRIAHGYSFIDHAVIRVSVEQDVPRLERAIRLMLDQVG